MRKIGSVEVVGVDYTLYLYEDGEFETLQNDAADRDKRYLAPAREDKIDGYCDYVQKEIRVYRDKFTDYHYFEQTVRHELVHAFLYEVGNSNHGDEDYVDKISKWTPHIESLFHRVEMQVKIVDLKPKEDNNA